MNISNLIKDDDAVSPVIGVILMVAITVILAAVIGAFVLNLGGSQASAPQAQTTWTDDADSASGGSITVTLEHNGGDPLPSSEITASLSAGSAGSSGSASFGSDMEAGASQDISTDAYEGNEITISWNNPNGDDSQILAEHTVGS